LSGHAPTHVVVVGAGLGGLRTIEALRSGGYQGQITLIGAERHPPYDRPPLSKQLLHGQWEPPRVTLCDRDGLAGLGVSALLGTRAIGLLDTTVRLDDGGSVTGDAVVLATGAVARTVPGQPPGVSTLRTLDDALALRRALDSARSLLIVGGGFIGAEVAWAARRRGIAVTVLEALPVPCERVLGPAAGALAARLFTEAGIGLRCGVQVARIADDHTVELADGTVASADVVLVSIGAAPDLAWLADAGPRQHGGIACDYRGLAALADGTRAGAVWAVGDAAAWLDPVTGVHQRTEHWTTTTEQAALVARGILGDATAAGGPSRLGPSYVWSDQFGLKIQVSGRTGGTADVRQLHGTGLAGGPVKGTVAGYYADGVLVGVASFGAPAQFMRCRTEMAAPR
jgi:NADPH-dependent 2,4-dienoyl-CoA reductase/sulfur reductase-like enzyme